MKAIPSREVEHGAPALELDAGAQMKVEVGARRKSEAKSAGSSLYLRFVSRIDLDPKPNVFMRNANEAQKLSPGRAGVVCEVGAGFERQEVGDLDESVGAPNLGDEHPVSPS